MKVKLIEQGWETYTGQMGVTFFVDGLSTADVSTRDARRIAAAMRAEWEDGSTLSPSELILENADTPAPVMPVNVLSDPVIAEELWAPEPDPSVSDEPAPMDSPDPDNQRPQYTEVELAELIDSGGIAALRDIADPLGIKGRSVNDILDDLRAGGYVKVE